MRKIFFALVAALFLFNQLAGQTDTQHTNKSDSSAARQIKITILYNNTAKDTSYMPGNGFSCFIEGLDKTIFFDSGAKSDILLHNMKQAGIHSDSIQLLMISHIHFDHIGGLFSGSEYNEQVITLGESGWKNLETAFLPVEIPDKLAKNQIVYSSPASILPNVYLSGVLPGVVPDKVIHGDEQSLIINTEQGLVIITGCAHPGIVTILKRAKEILNKKIFLVLGGFHLVTHSEVQLNSIIDYFKSTGVEFCAPIHCSGDKAGILFKEAYGNRCLELGAGDTISLNNNKLVKN